VALDGSVFAATVGYSAAAVAAVLVVTFAVAHVAGKHSVIDTAWGLLFCSTAITAFVASNGHGDAVRRTLLLALPLAWGLRLATHIGRRSRGRPEDPRYARMLDRAKGNRQLYALRSIYLLQGLLALVIASPIVLGSFDAAPVRVTAWIGVALWLVGVIFEAVGDAQLERWRADPSHKGKVIDVGLWHYTRHPNYFGDACVWWGIFLIAADGWPGVVTIYAPVLMTILLTKGSGVRVLEQHMARRDGWDDYAARTSVFVPLPPAITRRIRAAR
jgi:steroid 5-alpha reductase family enzyme